MPKSKSPLKEVQTEGDGMKSEVDEFIKECQQKLEDSGLRDQQTQMKKLFSRCNDLQKKVTKLEIKASKLKKSQEPSHVNRFDEVKKDELERISSFKEQLLKVSSTLEPDEVEEDYFRKVNKKRNNTKDDDDEDDEDDDDDDDEDDDDDVESTDMNTLNGQKDNEKVEDGLNTNTAEFSSSEANGTAEKGKLSRFGLFRKSSAKQKSTKPPAAEVEAAVSTKEAKDVDEGNKDDKGKPDKALEKERKEKEKKEKKEKERLEKEEREKERKEQREKAKQEKEKMKEEARERIRKAREQRMKGKEGGGKGSKNKEKEDDQDEEGIDGEEENEDEDETEEETEDEDEDEEASPKVTKDSTKSNEKEVKKDEDSGRKSGLGRFFRSKSPDRKVKLDSKEKEGTKQKTENVKGPSKGKSPKSSKKEVVEEESEEDEDEDYDDDEEDDDDEDEEDDDDEDVQVDRKPQGVKGMPKMMDMEASEEGESYEETDDEDDDLDEEEEEEEEEGEEGDELEETGASEDEEGAPPEGESVFEAVCDFDAEEPTDLAFRRGDVVTILSTRQDGWWMAEDEVGNKGLVPSTYLKLKKDYSDMREVQTPEQEGAPFERSGKDLWKSVRKSLTETSATDVLSAMGAIPSGFRPSWTAKLLKEEKYSLCSYLKPLLSESNLMFKDLLWNPQENKLRARPTRIQKMVQLMLVRNMPSMGVGLEAKSRHVRMAIFDGEKVLSNIHTVQATWNESDLKTWRFSPKVLGLLPSILDGDCFIRTDYSEKRIGLLFELCMSYLRTKTGETGEFGCGWVHLPLFDESTGGPVVNRVFDLPVKGGTPFEQDVEVDPSISRKAANNKIRSMLSANKQPHLQIRLITPTKEQKPLLETLPDTIVSATSYLLFLSFYRKLLGDVLLRDRIDMYSTDLIHSPVLAGFPEVTRFPDIMDALRSTWADKKRTIKRSDKRDGEQMKNVFSSVFMEIAYPLLHSATLPKYEWPDITSEQNRWEAISNFTKESKQKGVLAAFLSPGKAHMPFDASEVTFDLLGAYTKR